MLALKNTRGGSAITRTFQAVFHARRRHAPHQVQRRQEPFVTHDGRESAAETARRELVGKAFGVAALAHFVFFLQLGHCFLPLKSFFFQLRIVFLLIPQT